jgi:hypothetical protein
MALSYSAAIVNRHWEAVKAVSVVRTLVVGSPSAPLAQPFSCGAVLGWSLPERGEELVAHLGGHLVADRAPALVRLGVEKALYLFRTCAGGPQGIQQAAHAVVPVLLPGIPQATTLGTAPTPPPGWITAQPATHAPIIARARPALARTGFYHRACAIVSGAYAPPGAHSPPAAGTQQRVAVRR